MVKIMLVSPNLGEVSVTFVTSQRAERCDILVTCYSTKCDNMNTVWHLWLF